MRSFLTLLFLQFIIITVFSQEVLNDLFVNPVLVNKKQPTPLKSANATLDLPFFDDFSVISGYPSSDIWEDFDVFVNATYGINPPSIGVATFDAVDSQGLVYPWLTDNPSPADKLTSRPINLSNANQNSTYLSFYYQPQGNGNAPESSIKDEFGKIIRQGDSLVLNVITKDSIYRIWYSDGTDYKSFVEDSLNISPDRPDTLEFKLVHLKLDKPEFFTNSSQIQFINYASIAHSNNLSGRTNADHWNVDYIYLNEGRSSADTIFEDLAMVEPSTLFMKDYSSVPWSHFEAAINKQLNDLYFHVRNNGSTKRSMNQLIINIKDLEKGTINDFYIGQKYISPYENQSDLLWNFSNSPIDWYDAESASFEISGEIKTDTKDSVENNFSTRIVNYKNYYAYDDGTAEKAYGVDNLTSRVAYKYNLAKGDSLRAVQMYFVRNIDSESAVQTFTLCVWNDKNNTPGELILEETGKRPVYSDNLNEFVIIPLDSTLFLDGIFYIGWKQNSDLLMNVGYDANTIRPGKLFYEISSEWFESDFKGSLMMRPVFSSKPLSTTVAEKHIKNVLQIAPNPSKGTISILNNQASTYGKVTIYNCIGIKVFENNISTLETLDVNHLMNGIYIISYTPEKGITTSTRLIITK